MAVLAGTRSLSPGHLVWALALVIGLSGIDRRAAGRVSPRVADVAVPLTEVVGIGLLALVPFTPVNSRAGLLALGALLLPVLLVGRGLALLAVRAACRRGWIEDRGLVVGIGTGGRSPGPRRHRPPRTGNARRRFGGRRLLPVEGVSRLGSLADLEGVARRERVTRILLAFSSSREAEMVRLLIACERLRAEIYAVPRFFEVGVDGASPDEISGIPLMMLPRPLQRRPARAVKRGFDILVSLGALTALSPLLLLVAAAVRFSGPRPFVGNRPILFRQIRVGLDGREFAMFKFRSMVPNDDGDRTWSVVGDPRITKVGAFLRRTGLDEAPQLWNVLRGDMSLVGPRPERPLIADVFAASIPEYQSRHRVRVGITGWAQVNGLRGDTSIVDRARLDNYYVATWSLVGDITILMRTAALLVRHTIPHRELRGRPRATSWVTEVTEVTEPDPAMVKSFHPEPAVMPMVSSVVVAQPLPTQSTLVQQPQSAPDLSPPLGPEPARLAPIQHFTAAEQPVVAQTPLLHVESG